MTSRTLPTLIGVLIAAIGLTVPQSAYAQGNGNGRPKGPKPSTPTATPAATTTTTNGTTTSPASGTILAPVNTFPQFGSWLDDASAPTKGDGSVSIGAGYWRLSGMTQTNVPMIGAGVGVTDRLQVSASVPFYRASAPTWSANGLDDVYMSAKYTLLDPTLTVSEVGLAVSPVLEVLSGDVPDGRVHFALPVSIEVRRLPFRVYASGGYFTRGSIFEGGALEWTSPAGISFTGTVMHSYSLKTPIVPAGMIADRQHVDVGIGAASPLGRSASIYGSVGRSLTSIEAGGTSLAVTGGIALRFSAAASAP